MTATSPWGTASRAPMRVGLGLLNAFAMLHGIAVLMQGTAVAAGPTTPLVHLLRSPVVAGALVVLAVALLALFAWGRRPLATGSGALVAVALLQHALAGLDSRPDESLYLPGVALLGWCAGLLFGRAALGETTGPRAEAIAEFSAAGAVAGLLALPGLSQLVQPGSHHAAVNALRSVMVGAATFEPGSLGGRLQAAVVDDPALTLTLTRLLVAFQLAAVVYPLQRRTRLVYGTGVLALMGLELAFGLRSVDAAFALVALFTYPWPALARRFGGLPALASAPAAPDPRRVRRALLGAVVVAVTLPAAAFRLSRDPKAETGAPPAFATSGPESIHRGDVSFGWTFAATRPEGAGFCFTLERPDARVVFYVVEPGQVAATFPCAPGDAGTPTMAGQLVLGTYAARYEASPGDQAAVDAARAALADRFTGQVR